MSATLTQPAHATTWFESRPETFGDKFNRVPFTFTHRLTGDPLFEPERLLHLAKELARNPQDVYYDAGDVRVDQRWDEVGSDLPIDVLMHQIETAGAWIVLSRAEKDPEYAALLRECLDEVAQRSGLDLNKLMKLQNAIVFMNSPNRISSYHIDRECDCLLQLRGTKAVSVFDRADRAVLPEEEIERFWAGDRQAPASGSSPIHRARRRWATRSSARCDGRSRLPSVRATGSPAGPSRSTIASCRRGRRGAVARPEERRVFILRERARGRGRRRRDFDRALPSFDGARRAAPVGGKVEHERRVAQTLVPTRALFVERAALGEMPLPHGKVTVLHRQRRQRTGWGVGASDEVADLLEQHAHRPTVAHDVVQSENEDALGVAQADEQCAGQRTVGEIERAPHGRCAHGVEFGIAGFEIVRLECFEWKGSGRLDDLRRLAVDQSKCGTEHLVTMHDPLERSFKRRGIDAPAQAQRFELMVGRVARCEQLRDPHRFLRERERYVHARVSKLDAQDALG
jgi:hypothetical protein